MKKNYIFLILMISFLSTIHLYADASNGAKLFEGATHFKNGAVSCIACHSVDSKSVHNGGKLAINLTSMGAAGISYTIEKPENASSPIMKQAYMGKALTKSEQTDLLAFFDKAAGENAKSSSSTSKFFINGIIGAIIIFLLLSLLGKNRKKQSVNQELYDRQLKTSWRN